MKTLLSISITVIFSLILNLQLVNASEIKSGDDISNKSNQSLNEPLTQEKTIKPRSKDTDIFGDEQTFPFVAGLGKNAAH